MGLALRAGAGLVGPALRAALPHQRMARPGR